MSQPQEILVRAPNWTGDLIMATPGFRALRAGFPHARITCHLPPGLLPLLAGNPWFDELLPLRSHGRGHWARLREALALRERRFDLGLCLPDSFSSALVMRLAGVRQVVGYRRGQRRALLHRAVAPPPGAGRRWMISREEHVLGLVTALGCEPQGTHLELFVTDDEQARADARLRSRGVLEADVLAALAPGASFGPSKCWPAESFAHVGDALARAGARVVLLGTDAERALTARVAECMSAPAADLAGQLDLGGLKAVLRRSRVLVCNDAGARHVAVAFGVPCVVMMGPTSLDKTNLNLERVKVLTADVSCRPCYKRECPIDHRCMTRIPAEQVAEEALPALAADAAEHWRGERLEARPAGQGRSAA